MPFKSEAQRRFMYARHPKIAKKWEKHTPKGKKLPKKIKKEKTAKEAFELKIHNILELLFEAGISKGAGSSVKGATSISKGLDLEEPKKLKKRGNKAKG